MEKKYDMTFEEAQRFESKRGYNIPWMDDDIVIDERHITESMANVVKWADDHPVWHNVADNEFPENDRTVLFKYKKFFINYDCFDSFNERIIPWFKENVEKWRYIVD